MAVSGAALFPFMDNLSSLARCMSPGVACRYPLADSNSGEYLPVATTRPETILGDTAVAVNPADERYQAFVGRTVTVPMSGGRTIPVIADEYVDMEFGTGALKITPGADLLELGFGL